MDETQSERRTFFSVRAVSWNDTEPLLLMCSHLRTFATTVYMVATLRIC